MPQMILCCGEALIDMLPRRTEAGEAAFAPHSGGAVFNTAIALGRLGQSVGLVSGISTDMFGQQLQRDLGASNVDTSRLILSDRPSTLAFVELTAGQARYAFFDENTAGRMIAPADLPALTDDVCTLFFGGISLACEPCADTYAGLLTREGAGRVIMIDPNIRPAFIADAARYRARLQAMIARCDILKISDEDLGWLIAGPEGTPDRVAAIRAGGPSLVIVTRGGDGATAYLADGTAVDVPARKVRVVDTVGAGDTFNAGVLDALQARGLLGKAAIRALTAQDVQSMLSHAAAVAAITVSRAGANPPWAQEIAG